jgi:DNA-binding PadR family transcriptional regulator
MYMHIDGEAYMSLPHLLLGLLNISPMSGYDLNKEFNTTIQHFWSTDQSQIYRTLYKLEEDKRVRVETIIQEDNPNKKVYHITEAGMTELSRWLAEPLPEVPLREAWLGQLFFSEQLENEVVIDVLEVHLGQVEQRLMALEALQALFPSGEARAQIPRRYQFQLLTLDYGLDVHRFHVEWLKRAIEQIRRFPE